MAELSSEVFDLKHSDLPIVCAGGLALGECVYTIGVIEKAANHTPDRIIWRRDEAKVYSQVLVCPPCSECDQRCVARFAMKGNYPEVGSQLELGYEETVS